MKIDPRVTFDASFFFTAMLEAKLQEAALLKRLLDSIKELVTDANFQCKEEGIELQAMDNSHVALVSVNLDSEGFKRYRCDRPMPLGVNLTSLTKVLKCAKDDDIVILNASDNGDTLKLVFEARRSDRLAEYEMKLMEIDSESLSIPPTEYDARVTMPSSEFSRIVRDLSLLGESVKIEVSKEGVRFSSEGEVANGNVLLKQTDGARDKYANYGDEDDEVKQESEDEEEASSKKTKTKKLKKDQDADENAEDDEGEFKSKSDDEGEEEVDESSSKKRKKPPTKNGASAKKPRKSEHNPSEGGVMIEMNQHVSLTFSLKYLVNFSKSSSVSDTVQVMMSNDVPLLVCYKFGQGSIKYYLAPKIGEE